MNERTWEQGQQQEIERDTFVLLIHVLHTQPSASKYNYTIYTIYEIRHGKSGRKKKKKKTASSRGSVSNVIVMPSSRVASAEHEKIVFYFRFTNTSLDFQVILYFGLIFQLRNFCIAMD